MTYILFDMTTAADNGDQPDALSLHENAQNLLLALHNADNHRASTSDLRKPTGLSAANISGRHAKTLIREGWVEKVGKEDVGARSDANVYELTHRGKREANRLLREKPLPMSEEDRVVAIRKLKKEVRELKGEAGGSSGQSTNEVADRLESHEARLDEIVDRLDDHEDRLVQHDDRLGKIDSVLETAIDKIAEVRKKVSAAP